VANFQAVASVTAALRQRLLETVQVDVPAATVTALRPADPGTAGIPATGVNLFLFAVHISAAHRNRDLPLRGTDGDLRQVPVIPLELDYMISFYGDQNGAAHQLVGSVMRSLYARPILTSDMIGAVEGGTTGLNSGLASQADRVRFTPLPLPIEEISKLWSVFFQTSYVLSVAFRAGPVMIEADIPASVGPPVLTPQVAVFELNPPVVTGVTLSGAAASALIIAGSTIDILGSGFDVGTSVILIGTTIVTPSSGTTTRLTATLPASLPAGPLGLQVRQNVTVAAGTTRPATLSNLAAFVLHPIVTTTANTYNITVADQTGTGAAPRGATVSVTLAPAVGASQTATLELLDLTGAIQYMFNEAPRSAAATTVAYPVAGIPAGTYVLRARVDSAETPVVTDTTAGSPTLGKLVPQVTFA
jgi:hypothetical protein